MILYRNDLFIMLASRSSISLLISSNFDVFSVVSMNAISKRLFLFSIFASINCVTSTSIRIILRNSAIDVLEYDYWLSVSVCDITRRNVKARMIALLGIGCYLSDNFTLRRYVQRFLSSQTDVILLKKI